MARTLSRRRQLLAVACGGFLGTITRYLLSLFIQGLLGKGWPYDILLINITGAFVLAFVTTLADATLFVGPTRRLFINVGFMGAYTTFSSMALGDILLFMHGNWLPALLYIIISLLGGVIVVIFGDFLAQRLIRAVRPKRISQPLPVLSQITQSDITNDHLDMEDDLFISDRQDEREMHH